MRFFVSHSSKDKDTAERIALALRNLGHESFFDRDSLPPGDEYDNRIRSEVMNCDRFLFCLTRNSTKEGSYALTELSFARERWEHPKEKVLTVLLDDFPIEQLTPYLSAATVLRPVGNVAAEVAGHVARFEEVEQKLRTSRRRFAIVILCVVAVAVVSIAYVVANPKKTRYELANDRLHSQLPGRPGFKPYVYSQFGFGFLAPSSWQVEDQATPYGVPDIDIIQRYTDQKAAIGVELRLIPVQPNYINDFNAEVRNQADVFRNIDSGLEVIDTTIAGIPAKSFRYEQRTGKRIGEIERTWLRLAPEVKLQVLSFTYTDEPDRIVFLDEVRRIKDSIVVDQDRLSAIRKEQRLLLKTGAR